MEPAMVAGALKVLGKVFSVGLAAYKVRRDWTLDVQELEQIESFVSGSVDLVGMLRAGGGASPRMFALHTALAMVPMSPPRPRARRHSLVQGSASDDGG